jgi:hypothetical protein
MNVYGGQPIDRCLYSSEKMAQRITADKREIKDSPKLPSATSFILDTLY